jgi:uncharacterized protein
MTNRLAGQTSPYLLQHAENPVDWQPWDDQALADARKRDVPILLSIGYAACHWCHVMEHESFSDPATAAVMNDGFVCIKVDREERPDLDSIYMEAVQAMTGSGGWPMTVFLTPDARPFYGGTYFPPQDRHGLPAFTRLLEAITESWERRRSDVEEQAGRLTGAVNLSARLEPSAQPLERSLVTGAVEALKDSFDARNGGFSRAPKFPQPMVIELMMRAAAAGDEAAGDMATQTLDAMADGGMFDQLGGGFHRYSVDDTWTVPHFEKMLYDNALLLRTYARSYLATGSSRHLEVAEATASWMLTEMRDRAGGFFSSLDADSEGHEGLYYVWDLAEVREVAGHEAGEAESYWGFSDHGNFEGRNIPIRAKRDGSVNIERLRERLLERRATRIRPATDDKVLVCWNALAASALAEAGAALGKQQWVDAAAEAVTFILTRMQPEGRLARSARRMHDGSYALGPPAFCEDHAALLEALLALFEATGHSGYLETAVTLADRTVELFADPKGGFFSTGSDGEKLLSRPKDVVDNAVPSSNSILALELQRLSMFTSQAHFADQAVACLSLVAKAMERSPFGFAHALCAADLMCSRALEVVIVGPRSEKLLTAIRGAYLPNKVLVPAADTRQLDWLPLLEGRTELAEATAFVCSGGTCRAPVTTEEDMFDAIGAA